MKILLLTTIWTALCFGVAAANPTDPTSGLPVPPGYSRVDPIHSYSFCGKRVLQAPYMAGGDSDSDHINDWYAHQMPSAARWHAENGSTAFIPKDGTIAVKAQGVLVFYYRITPGLTASQSKLFGTTTKNDGCAQ